MRKSLATVCLSGGLPEKLDAAAAAGFDGVEIFEPDLVAARMSPEEVRDRTAELGLRIELHQPFRDFETTDPAALAANLRRADHKFRLMERLGADLLLVCSSVSPDAPEDDAETARQLRLLARRAADRGIRIAYEALAWGRHVDTWDRSWRVVREADHPALGLCLDSFHILSRGSDPSGIADVPGDRLFFLQLADAPRTPMDVLQWSRHHRRFPGQGDFDLTGLVRHTVDAGYTGPLSLEVFNDVFRQADARRTAVDAMRSLLVLEERTGLATLPAPPVPTGLAFAEIATGEAEPLRVLLHSLGFARTGRHPGKPVELWEQGEARVLVNTGVGGPHEGPALVALGLETAAPDQAVRRAESLLAPVLPRRRAPGDTPLDAVSAPDGTELFLCRTAQAEAPDWRDDFAPLATGEGPAPIGVRSVDHVALPQPWHHFDEATLFHHGVLGLRVEDGWDLADPYGLHRSRAVSHPGGALRIALNLAPGPDGEVRRPQHLALATDDLVDTVRRAREAGAPLLPVPCNYYDDLAARHDLDDAFLSTLRELDILYDRDEHGAFLHCYTATRGRVFFELTQRVGNYRGYGAANAPVRLAAQHRARPLRE